MSRPNRLYWWCLTCNNIGCIEWTEDSQALLMCRCAHRHATAHPDCKAIADAVCWWVPAGLIMEARADAERRGARVIDGRVN